LPPRPRVRINSLQVVSKAIDGTKQNVISSNRKKIDGTK